MVLEKLNDGASWHIQDLLDDEGTRRLVFMLCLPLVDGVFATLLVTGAVSTFSDILAVALTIFSGAGAIAVLYSYAETVKEAKIMVMKAAPVLLAGSFMVSLVAPVFQQILYVDRVGYAAGLALLSIALQMAGLEKAEVFSPSTILVTGLVLSVRSPSSLVLSLEYVAPALLTAGMAVGGLYLASYFVGRLNLTYVRRGGAAVLTLISMSLFGVQLPSELGLAVLAISLLASLEPDNLGLEIR